MSASRAIQLAVVASLCAASCASEGADPFGSDGGGGARGVAATTSSTTGGGGGGAPIDDPTLGGPCAADDACDDGADCTADRCDLEVGRCRFTPDDAACDDGIFCDGVEVCTPRVGCEEGPPHDCGDGDACTIDTCVEATRTCRRDQRDADGDGDVDGHCPGGGDCDDGNPARSSDAPEACGNGLDDDCDGEVDEEGCVAPRHDDCDDPAELGAGGAVTLALAGTDLDLPTTCAPDGAAFDAVARVEVPAGPPRDVDVRARTDMGEVSLAIVSSCGALDAELACGPARLDPDGDPTSRALARGVPGGSEVAIVVTTTAPREVVLDVRVEDGSSAPTNETCGTATDLAPGEARTVDLVDAAEDVGTACLRQTGDLVFRVPLAEAADVEAFATSLDGEGLVSLSVRSAACALPEDELACRTSLSPRVFRRDVPAGEVFVALSATAPTVASVVVTTSPPTPSPQGDACEDPLALAPGESLELAFEGHQDDVAPCAAGGVDAAIAFDLDAASDVLVVQHVAGADAGGLALLDAAACGAPPLACASGARPVRLRRRGLGEGSWAVIAETFADAPQRVDLLARPAGPSLGVPLADGCPDAQPIPPRGGFFVGNTAGASGDLDAGCDDEGQPPGGAPDRLLRLDLEAPSRVVLDMSGTSYDAMLSVRRGACPGEEVPLACTVASGAGAPFLDLELDAGTHHVQIDGRSGASGPFQLDVHVSPL